MQERLDKNEYAVDGIFNVKAFDEDVKLVWQNAFEFNSGETSAFGTIAKIMQVVFERRMKDVMAAPQPASAMLPPVKAKRLRALHDCCTALPLPAASELVEIIEEACPPAVRRRGDASSGRGLEARVELDQIDEGLWDVLADRAKRLRKDR